MRRQAVPLGRPSPPLISFFVSVLCFLAAGSALGQEITRPLEASVERGLSYLAKQQRADGSWDARRYPRNTGIGSLATLAFLATGNLPDQGRYGRTVRRGVAFVIGSRNTDGLLIASPSHGPMYEHAFSTLLLAETWGTLDMPDIRPVLERAVDIIVQSQNRDGGWRYKPSSRDADLSVTTAQIVALRAAENAGLEVPAASLTRAARYIRSCAHPEGGFTYMPGDERRFARTAMGAFALQMCGEYDAGETRAALRHLRAHPEGDPTYPYYGRYYAAQALFQEREEHWEPWFTENAEWLLRRQNPDGSWDGEVGRIYGTALAILTLAIPYRYLPIYQR